MTNAQQEPILVPAIVYTILATIAAPVAIAWLTNGDVKTAIASVITVLIGRLVVDRQVIRPKVTSNVTAQANVDFAVAAGYAQGAEDTKQAP